jgi:UbiD family decarboxylase
MSTTLSLAYKDLREYIDAVERLGELRVVNGADWNLEIGAITEVAARAAQPKVVLFDNIKGYPKGFRVIVNAVCSATTTGLAFGLDPTLSGMDMIRAWEKKLGSYHPLKPVDISYGPVTENVESGDKVDMLKFPTPRWHEHDGGHFIGTACNIDLNLANASNPDDRCSGMRGLKNRSRVVAEAGPKGSASGDGHLRNARHGSAHHDHQRRD